MKLTILLTSRTDDSKFVSVQHTREFSQVFTLVQLSQGEWEYKGKGSSIPNNCQLFTVLSFVS